MIMKLSEFAFTYPEYNQQFIRSGRFVHVSKDEIKFFNEMRTFLDVSSEFRSGYSSNSGCVGADEGKMVDEFGCPKAKETFRTWSIKWNRTFYDPGNMTKTKESRELCVWLENVPVCMASKCGMVGISVLNHAPQMSTQVGP